MAKIFPHFTRRKRTKPAAQPLLIKTEDPERHRARVALERREAERIEADRRRRMLERRAARVVHAAPSTPKDQSDLDAEWFAAHPDRHHLVRRKVAGEIPAHLDFGKWVAIRQVRPGVRIRLPFNVPYGKRKLLDLIATEKGAAMMFDLVAADPQAKSLDVDGIEP